MNVYSPNSFDAQITQVIRTGHLYAWERNLIGNKESKIAPGRFSFRWERSVTDLKGNLQETLNCVTTLRKSEHELKKNNKLRGLSPQGSYPTERPPIVGEVSANFCG
jgi:hypothetical protein